MSGPGAGTPVIPETMRAFVLDGTGREHAAVRRVPTPVPGPGQLLGRVDAAGICSSVNKVIGQGPEHSLMYGRDLAAHPAILGDEGAITVVAAATTPPTSTRSGRGTPSSRRSTSRRSRTASGMRTAAMAFGRWPSGTRSRASWQSLCW